MSIFHLFVAGAVVCTTAGCSKQDPEAAEAAKTPAVVLETQTSPPPPPPAGKPAPAAPVDSLNSGMSSDQATGIPTTDGEKNLSAQQGLQRAVDYYNRSMVPASTPQAPGDKRKMLPPLTSLQQLVDYRVIKAIPPAPDGKKWVLEGTQVKLQ
jgi:hypothetical protein